MFEQIFVFIFKPCFIMTVKENDVFVNLFKVVQSQRHMCSEAN